MPTSESKEILSLRAGQIVLADWRGDARPGEQNKLRPAIVVDEESLFEPHYTNAILVPLSSDALMVIRDLVLAITPTAENGCPTPCWALSYMVSSLAKTRMRTTPSQVISLQLRNVRQQIAFAIGI